MAILNNNPLVGASGNQGGYNINNSLRFRSSASAFLNRTPASAGNRRTWTWSAWVKTSLDCSFMYAKNGNYGTKIYFNDNKFGIFDWQAAVAIYWEVASSAVFRDPSAWYHLVVAVDTTQATASNRVKLYVNGNQITALATSNYPTQNYDGIMNTANPTFIGKQSTTIYGEQSFYDGYMAEVNFIDGSAKTPSDFGETDTTTGVWKPKAYTGTYGTNGFYLKFSDIATTSGSNAGLGKDFSGNSNYWTTNNISVTAGTTYDAMTDVPTNTSATVANYAVMNPIAPSASSYISNGNLTVTVNNGSVIFGSTITLNGGKFYCEFDVTSLGGAGIGYIGIYNGSAQWWYQSDGQKYLNGTSSAYGATWTTGDNIGVAFDDTTGTLTFYKNGTSQGAISTGVSSNLNYTFSCIGGSATSRTYNANFGQRAFSYSLPSTYVALNTYNLPTPTILQGNKYMDATLYTGNGSTQTITNAAGFKPDFVWAKRRSSIQDNVLFDSVRGVTKWLVSNATSAEGTYATSLTSFNSDGFTLGGINETNASGSTYVGWQWQAGQGSTSSNTSGSITSTVSVNTTAGFSIVTYSGATSGAKTVGHGLGIAPKMIIIKWRTGGTGQSWAVYHASLGNDKYLALNTTAAAGTDTNIWQNTAPTSSVFSVGYDTWVNNNGFTYVAYCWAEIAGFSSFGSYTGNGSADGPFVYTGFRPKFIIFKQSSAAGEQWLVFDSVRTTYNIMGQYLHPSLSNAESTFDSNDFLSNGFKIRVNHPALNTSGATYIYMAFAENPFKNSLAR